MRRKKQDKWKMRINVSYYDGKPYTKKEIRYLNWAKKRCPDCEHKLEYWPREQIPEGCVIYRAGRPREIELIHMFYCPVCDREYPLEELVHKSVQEKAMKNFIDQEN